MLDRSNEGIYNEENVRPRLLKTWIALSTTQRISIWETNCTIHWIGIYPSVWAIQFEQLGPENKVTLWKKKKTPFQHHSIPFFSSYPVSKPNKGYHKPNENGTSQISQDKNATYHKPLWQVRQPFRSMFHYLSDPHTSHLGPRRSRRRNEEVFVAHSSDQYSILCTSWYHPLARRASRTVDPVFMTKRTPT